MTITFMAHPHDSKRANALTSQLNNERINICNALPVTVRKTKSSIPDPQKTISGYGVAGNAGHAHHDLRHTKLKQNHYCKLF